MWRQTWDWFAGREAGASLKASKITLSARQVDALISDLKSTDETTRIKAAEELGFAGAAAASEALVASLADPVEDVVLNATYALAAIGAPAIPAMRQLFLEGSDPHRKPLVYALGAMGSVANDLLLEGLDSSKEQVRCGAAYALGLNQRPSHDIVAALVKAAADSNATVRYTAIDSIGQIGKIASVGVDVLIDRLSDAEAETRFNAALALARIGPEARAAVPRLQELFLDPNRYVRGYAIEALHRIGTPEALDVIIKQLKTSRWCPITATDNHFYP
jgi:HEAT repeat protein